MFDLFGNLTPTQSDLAFPVSLTERYRPHSIDEFAGLDKPKRLCRAIAARPYSSATLLTLTAWRERIAPKI